jgi:hypothetical protein
MKIRSASLTMLALCLAIVPAVAQEDFYDNGPINGTTDAWTIGSGFVVSDTFTTQGGGFNSLTFGAWLTLGDTLQSAEVSVTSSEFGGTSFFDETVNFTQSSCVTNQLGFNVCTEFSRFGPLNLNPGTYWLNLSNATTALGQAVYWDENSGPSSASENTIGTIPSESFTLLYFETSQTSTTSSTTTTPEPTSIMLFGSGILSLAGALRRKLF